ncbi:hypothetical protein VISI1226_10184 [Vibrio sinaloensis DSM 21326]|uniref:Uncharacterized protein n=1 Tax=Vibrio sinaloensis DSM 21326 TaxID=945550 RepID=E8M8A5_PHOS4|nr:hypothetical protein [Vibrio sinaloensis]EGA69797.1 hypothetical protein VISI1226_10184 [Vibrio sinaloensis DSM 21326]
MEILKLVLAIAQNIAWPLLILYIVVLLKKPISKLVAYYTSQDDDKERDIKVKMGSFEIHTNRVDIKQQQDVYSRDFIETLAKEPDERKRLEMVDLPIAAKNTIGQLDEESVQLVEKLASRRLSNSFILNFNNPEVNGFDISKYSELRDKGLVNGAMLDPSDDICWLTPLGVSVVREIEARKQSHNKAFKADSQRMEL